jgi:hypothetical protein
MAKQKTSKVFVPGGMPNITYIPRNELELEAQLQEAVESQHKLITVTGQTKSGKTVLVNRVLPRSNADENIWVDGGAIDNEDDFWTTLLENLGVYESETSADSSGSSSHMRGTVGGELGMPYVGGLKGDTEKGIKREKAKQASKTRTLTPRAAALEALQSYEGTLVIDDFHYLERGFQGKLVRALKPLIFEGLAVVAIAIPHRKYDAVKVEREMTGRIHNIDLPSWSEGELKKIAKIGFSKLNMEVASSVTDAFAYEAYGSPHLMQEFCQRLAKKENVKETCTWKVPVTTNDESLFREAAEGTGKVVYDKLATGPRQRSDRIQRRLSNGETSDIYVVILMALSQLAPGLETIEYEQLRGAIKNILSEAIPQAHEVTRVLERMSEIAASDEASTPVMDWDKSERQLHITDPFFAFYLKWGTEGA